MPGIKIVLFYCIIFPLLFSLPGIAAAEDENKIFGTDNMVVTNSDKMKKDPNKGTGRIFQMGGSISINSCISLGSTTGDNYLERQPFSFSSDLIAFMDSRINSHLRGYASLLYSYSHADRTNSGALNEAFIDFDIANRIYFRIGKQRFKTGFGQKWRISDWLNSTTVSVLDTGYSDSLRTGLTGIRMKTGFFTIFMKMPENEELNSIQLYLQGEFSIGNAHFILSHISEKGRAPAYSAGVSFGALGLDWYAEIALSGESRRDRVKLADPGSRTADPYANILVYREQKLRPLIIAGASYNNQARKFGFSAEYFYNGYGYENAALYPYAYLSGTAEPSYLGKHYLAVTGSKSEIFSRTDTVSLVLTGNLNDTSFALYPSWSTRINDNLSLSLSLTWYFGKTDGEYTFPRYNGESGQPFVITNPLTMEVEYGSDRDVLAANLRLQLSL